MITISFATQALHDSCVNLERAEQMFGSVSAAALVNFISEAMAFENVEELIAFLGDSSEVSAVDSLFVSIGADYRAALVVAGTRLVRDAGGRVVWSSVSRLKLMQISRLP